MRDKSTIKFERMDSKGEVFKTEAVFAMQGCCFIDEEGDIILITSDDTAIQLKDGYILTEGEYVPDSEFTLLKNVLISYSI